MPPPTLFTEEFVMVRIQSMLALLVCALVPLGALGGQPADTGPLISSPPKTPFVDETYQADPQDVGYAEGETDVQCCPSPAEYCPLWTVDAGAIFLSRNHAAAHPSAQVYVQEPRLNPVLVFDMANSGLGTAAGPDITLSRCLGPCWDLEARYFQVDGWRDNNVFSANSPGRVSVLAYGVPSTAQSVSLDYSSRLYNVELNLRWKRCESIPVLIGFRTLGLDERFQSLSLAGTTVGVGADTWTNNSLYGLQIGTEPILWDRCGWFRLEGLLKTGIYGNRAHQRTTFPLVGGQLNSTDTLPSFVGEAGLIGNVSLNRCWSLRAGYEVMWITNVALAPNQAATVQFGALPTGAMYDRATAFYYGATASIERKF